VVVPRASLIRAPLSRWFRARAGGCLLSSVLLCWSLAVAGQPGDGACTGPTLAELTSPTLSVASVNLAHGRGDGLNQLLQRGATARRNIASAAQVLADLDADVVALQEADAPSAWSGGFDHVLAVAEQAACGCRLHGTHARSPLFAYGTALLSRVTYRRVARHDFAPTPPTLRKGFVAAQVAWNPGASLKAPRLVTLVSAHLDFSRQNVREAQLAELQTELKAFSGPLVLMGDFNSQWGDESSLLRNFAREMKLEAWEPESENHATYGDARRLDWIFVSDELAIVAHRTLDTVVSDHRPIWARIRWRSESSPNDGTAPFSP